MEDINSMKEIWQEFNNRISHLEQEHKNLIKTVLCTNYRSTQEKLIRKYAGFIVVETIMIVFISLFFINSPEINDKYRIPALIYWDLFFIIEVLIDFYLMQQIKSVDIYESSINEVTKKAARNWKLHKIAIIVGLPMAFGAIIILALALNANYLIILGMLVGVCIGLILGIFQLTKFRNYYRLLQSNE